MGTTLEGKQINQTYQGLLKTTDNNEVGVDAKEITDGKGNGTGVTLDNSGNLVANATVTANAFVGDGSQLTGLPVTSVNTQTGDVVLDADNISDTSTTNKFTTAADISKLANIEANADVTDVANVTTSLNSISATELSDIIDVGSGSVITNLERTKLDGIQDNAQVNPTAEQIKASYESNTNTNAFTDALKSKLQNIEAGAEVNNINSVNGQVGTITLGLLNLDDVGADGASGEVLTTDGQGNFTFQAAGGGEGLVTRVNGATGNVVLDTDDIDEGTTNLYYTEARVSANTDVTANTAKVGITAQQATDITTNNAKVGITTQQANDILTNNAKISFDSASSTKLAGIEDGAEVNVNADWNATTGDAQILNKPTLATVATSGSYTDLSNTPTIPTNNNELTNGAEYINEASQLAHTIAIGSAIDFSARVTLAGGVAEGTSGIIKNLQSIL